VAQAEKAEAVEALAKAILDGSGSTDCRLVDDQVDDGTNEVS